MNVTLLNTATSKYFGFLLIFSIFLTQKSTSKWRYSKMARCHPSRLSFWCWFRKWCVCGMKSSWSWTNSRFTGEVSVFSSFLQKKWVFSRTKSNIGKGAPLVFCAFQYDSFGIWMMGLALDLKKLMGAENRWSVLELGNNRRYCRMSAYFG